MVRLEAPFAILKLRGNDMNRSIATFLVLAALAPAFAPLAAARDISTIDGWELSTTGKTCTMATTFADDVTIGLVWSPRTGELGFMAAGLRWNELNDRKTVALDLSFDGDGPITQWEDERATVVLGGTGKTAAIANWGADHTDELAKTVGAASHVTVRVGDRDLGSYDLAGNAAAYRALMRCGNQVAAK